MVLSYGELFKRWEEQGILQQGRLNKNARKFNPNHLGPGPGGGQFATADRNGQSNGLPPGAEHLGRPVSLTPVLPQGTQAAGDITTTILNLINGSTLDTERPIVGGIIPQFNRAGGWDAANHDFDNMDFIDVKYIGNGVRVGTLSDGNRVVVTPLSTPTLRIQDSNGKTLYKIRYK